MRLILLFFITFLSFNLNATEESKEQTPVNQVIYQLEKDGFIDKETSIKAIDHYKNNKELNNQLSEQFNKEKTSWTQYITFMNILKLIGIVLILIATRGILYKIIKSMLFIIIAVPLILYQTAALILGVMLTYNPEFFWAKEAFYVNLFGSTLNIIVVGWIMYTYEGILAAIIKLLNKIKISEEIFVLSLLTGYYYHLSLLETSMFYGTIAVMFFSGLFIYCVSRLFKDISEKQILYLFNFFGLGLFSLFVFLDITNVNHVFLDKLMFGLEYVSALIVIVSLLILSSPFFDRMSAILPSIMIAILSAIGFMFGMSNGYVEVSGLINTLVLITAFQWVFYLVKDSNYIIVCLVAGLLLFGTGKLIESYQNYFFTNLL